MESSVNQRIKNVFDVLDISQTDLANAIGTSKQTISLTFSGKTTPKADLIEKIFQVYKDINPEYIMTGQGNMFKSNTNGHTNFTPTKEESRTSQMIEEYKATIEKLNNQVDRLMNMLEREQTECIRLAEALGKSSVSKVPHGQQLIFGRNS